MSPFGQSAFASSAALQAACGKELQLHDLCLADDAKSLCEISGLAEVFMTENEKERAIAAALEYDDRKDSAPRVTAKGRGDVAERIIQLAKQHNVPIKKDPGLVQILSRLDIDDRIPPELYRAVAEILAFVYSLNEQFRTGAEGPESVSATRSGR